jgi:hypothetical protein
MRSLSIVAMSQIKLIPTPSWLVYFVLKAQPFFINFVEHPTINPKVKGQNPATGTRREGAGGGG